VSVDSFFSSFYLGGCCNAHQEAYEITGALVTLGVIVFVRKGQLGLSSRKAAVLYLVSQSENGAEEEDTGFEI